MGVGKNARTQRAARASRSAAVTLPPVTRPVPQSSGTPRRPSSGKMRSTEVGFPRATPTLAAEGKIPPAKTAPPKHPDDDAPYRPHPRRSRGSRHPCRLSRVCAGEAGGRPSVRRLVEVAWSGGAVPIVVVAPDPDGQVASALAGRARSLRNRRPCRLGRSVRSRGASPSRAGAWERPTPPFVWPASLVWARRRNGHLT